MPRRKNTKSPSHVKNYRHEQATRKDNPPIGLVSYEKAVKEPKLKTYAYDPHLSPQLVWANKPGLCIWEIYSQKPLVLVIFNRIYR